MAIKELSDKNPDGTRLGQNATDLVAFWGATSIAQASATAQGALVTTAAVSVSATQWGFGTSTQANSIIAQLNQVRATLVAMGLWKGSI